MIKIISLVLLIDQVTKLIMVEYFPNQNIILTSCLNFSLVYNKGISFGLFNNYAYSNYFFVALSSLIVMFLLDWLKKSKNNIEKIALELVVGGAIGNIIDRVIHQGVVDFIELHWHQYYWPSFNIADSSICLGVCILIYFSLRYTKSKKV